MGYTPSHENKVNIHVGGVYGDKEATLQRFAANFRRLSPGCQKRLTVENDDIPNSYSMQDLLPLHDKTGIPLVCFLPSPANSEMFVVGSVCSTKNGL